MGAKFMERTIADRQKYLDVGSGFGAQRMADLVSIALHDPEVMGKDVFGPERLKKVFARVKELEIAYTKAFSKGPEQDYYQEALDKNLREIFSEEDGFAPFQVRYPFIKEVRY